MNNGDMPTFTYIYDPDDGMMEMFIDGEKFSEIWCEGDPQNLMQEFRRIYTAGYIHAIRDREGK